MTPSSSDTLDALAASRHFNHACYHGLFDEALEWLSKGIDPGWGGESGKCGLHFSAMAGHGALCAFLSQQHPSTLLARDQAGMTPFHLACRNSKRDAALALARGGASFLARDDFGRLPLDCCPDAEMRRALDGVQLELAATEWAKAALERALAAPSIRSFI